MLIIHFKKLHGLPHVHVIVIKAVSISAVELTLNRPAEVLGDPNYDSC